MEEAGRKRRGFLFAAAAGLIAACTPNRKTGLQRGDTFPEFTLADIDGQPFSFGSTRGHARLINLWATWCEPCRREMPALDRLARTHAGRGLDVLTISLDDDVNLVREFCLRYRIGLPVLLDANQQSTKDILSGTALPRTYLVARDRRVREVVEGYRDWESPAADADLVRLLA